MNNFQKKLIASVYDKYQSPTLEEVIEEVEEWELSEDSDDSAEEEVSWCEYLFSFFDVELDDSEE